MSWLESNQAIDRLAQPIRESASRLLGAPALRDLLSGRRIGHPAHPVLIAIPIGTWTSALVADMAGERRAARILTATGLLSAAPTIASGLSDWVYTDGAESRVGVAHLVANGAATSLFAASWKARRNGHHGRGTALGLIGGALLGAGGWLGGHLSYALGVGVDTNSFDGGPTEWTALDEVDHAPDAAMWAASADGVSLVVVRREPGLVIDEAEPVRVLANRCSHRGGPLSDGALRAGCIECPWHGSRFDLDTGAVTAGPAVVGQAVYESRNSGEGTEVRRDEPRALRTNSIRA